MRSPLCYWLLMLIPFAVYGPAIMREYGLRDDYALIREAKEEPGKIARAITAQGRPLYGAMLETSFSRMETVDDLKYLRLVSVGLLGLLGIILWRHLDTNGWPHRDALALALAITLLPAAQISVGWAIGWPWICSLILSTAGFLALETELIKGGYKRPMGIAGGVCIYVLATLIYQPNALFAVVLIAATALPRVRMRTRQELIAWFSWHLAYLFLALVLSFLFVKLILSGGGVQASSRMVFETHPLSKLYWLITQMLPDALGLFALRGDFLNGALFFWLTVLLLVVFIYWIAPKEEDNDSGSERLKWWLCLAVLPWVAMFISMVAAERSTGYRTIFALSGLVLVVVFYCLRHLPVDEEIEPRIRYGAMGAILLLAGILANWNTSELIAKPQAREWSLIRDAVQRARLTAETRFYLVEPSLEDRSTNLVHGDEFGSLSTNADWVSQEMFKAALRARFPNGVPKSYHLELAQGRRAPAAGTYDVVIDMRELRRWRE